jgi:hypothetical protein
MLNSSLQHNKRVTEQQEKLAMPRLLDTFGRGRPMKQALTMDGRRYVFVNIADPADPIETVAQWTISELRPPQ